MGDDRFGGGMDQEDQDDLLAMENELADNDDPTKKETEITVSIHYDEDETSPNKVDLA